MECTNTKVSILMLTFNSPVLTEYTLKKLKKTAGIDYEVIVVDNASQPKTRKLVQKLYKEGFIDKLFLSDVNTFFSKGNNICFSMADDNSSHVLLLNADIEIRHKYWLKKLVDVCGDEAVGLMSTSDDDNRPDGFCYLVKKDIYGKYLLDEQFQWAYSLANMNSKLLRDGIKVKTIDDYENILFHFGRSSNPTAYVPTSNVTKEDLKNWYGNGKYKCELIDKVKFSEKGKIWSNPFMHIYSIWTKGLRKIKRKFKK